MARNKPLVFSEMKSKVGIDDVAYEIGYRLDKKAGVGKYFELILGEPSKPTDKIIVRNAVDKSQQFFFRRDGSKGDVITFIRENLHQFNLPGTNEWTRIANVLAKLSNIPIRETVDHKYVRNSSHTERQFETERYHVEKIDPQKIPYLLKNRGFSAECIRDFGHNVVFIRDTYSTKFDGLNIGFPYTNPENQALSGYEIRGNKGFKSKASGTDSSNSAWIAEFPKFNPQSIKNVYFFESSFDAMAFYQLNKTKIAMSNFALVSVGGAFDAKLVNKVMSRFPAAKAWDCFDNDLAGNMYSATLVKAIDKIDFSVENKDNQITIKYGDKIFQCPREKFDFRLSANSLGMCYSCGHWKSPSNYKDWNDCLLGKQIQTKISPSKYLRDENLANKRQASYKI